MATKKEATDEWIRLTEAMHHEHFGNHCYVAHKILRELASTLDAEDHRSVIFLTEEAYAKFEPHILEILRMLLYAMMRAMQKNEDLDGDMMRFKVKEHLARHLITIQTDYHINQLLQWVQDRMPITTMTTATVTTTMKKQIKQCRNAAKHSVSPNMVQQQRESATEQQCEDDSSSSSQESQEEETDSEVNERRANKNAVKRKKAKERKRESDARKTSKKRKVKKKNKKQHKKRQKRKKHRKRRRSSSSDDEVQKYSATCICSAFSDRLCSGCPRRRLISQKRNGGTIQKAGRAATTKNDTDRRAMSLTRRYTVFCEFG